MDISSTKRPSLLPLLLVAGMLLLTAAAHASEVSTTLGHDGTIFRLHQGPYGDLFAGGNESDPENPVLALEVLHDGASKSWLIPGSETKDRESSASLVVEKHTGTVHLVWQTLFNGQHPLLQLTSFDGDQFSELIEITGNVYADKGEPRLIVRRESERVGGDESGELRNRTTLHLTWWEEGRAVSHKRHALIVLEEGRYVGWAPIIDLGGYVLDGDTSAPPEVPGLEDALSLQAGRNHRAVIGGFINPRTHRLITVEIEALPQLIGNMADDVRAQIVVIGSTAGSRSELADLARSIVLDQGVAFHEAALQYLADQVAATIEHGDGDLSPDVIQTISDDVRAQIVVIGSRIGPGGLDNFRDSEVIAVGRTSNPDNDAYHYYQLTVVSDLEAPEVGGSAELILSDSGENVIVTWETEDRIHYRETTSDGWSDTISIALSDNLDRETIHRMLAQRVSGD